MNYLGQFSHPNLVKLIGYCLEDEHRLLVYEFMPRGSLENHLFRSIVLSSPLVTLYEYFQSCFFFFGCCRRFLLPTVILDTTVESCSWCCTRPSLSPQCGDSSHIP